MKVIQEEKERAARARERLRRQMEEEGRTEGEEEYEREATAGEARSMRELQGRFQQIVSKPLIIPFACIAKESRYTCMYICK